MYTLSTYLVDDWIIMKLRTSFLLAAVLALSACGGSSDTSSRNRNGLLETTTTAGPSTSTIAIATTVPTTTTAILESGQTTTSLVSQATASTGPPAIIPTPTSPSTTTVPTPIVPAAVQIAAAKSFSEIFSSKNDCAKGGMCRIGDTGPGGGIVFNISEIGFETPDISVVNHFVELTPLITASPTSLSTIRCSASPAKIKSHLSLEITNFLVKNCGLRKPSGPKLSDWYLPGANDLVPIVEFFQNSSAIAADNRESRQFRYYADQLHQMKSTYFFTSIPNSCRDIPVNVFFPANTRMPFISNDCYQTLRFDGAVGFALAVRSFGPTTRNCAIGGPCKTGDLGPHGGIVVHSPLLKPPVGQSTTFLEALTQPEYINIGPWCGPVGGSLKDLSTSIGMGPTNSQLLKNDMWTGLPCDVVLTGSKREAVGFAKGFVPSLEELKLLCTATTTLKRLEPVAQKQCGINLDIGKYIRSSENILSSHCPIGIACQVNIKGESSYSSINSIWTSSSKKGVPYVLRLNGAIANQIPFALINQKYNDSRAFTIPFYSFDAVLAK